MYAKFDTPRIANMCFSPNLAHMPIISLLIKKCPKWGPEKGARGCQRAALGKACGLADESNAERTDERLRRRFPTPGFVEVLWTSERYVVVPHTSTLPSAKRIIAPCMLVMLLRPVTRSLCTSTKYKIEISNSRALHMRGA